MGIAEQNMLGRRGWAGHDGDVPFISTFVAFAVVRPLDQVRVLIAQTGANVKITAGYAGLFIGRTGKSTDRGRRSDHARDAGHGDGGRRPMTSRRRGAPLGRARTRGQCYVRLVRDATQRLFDGAYAFELGQAVVVREGADLTLISTGAQTPRVVDAADLLAAKGIDAHILHVPTIKPLDVEAVVAAAQRTGFVITVEEHTVIGGLGGAVAETLSEHRPTIVKRIGLQDVFGQSASNDDLLDIYGLSAARVADQVLALQGART